jgi:four helix bundle protein
MTTSFEQDVEGGYRDPLERLQVYRLGLEAVRDARGDAEEFGRDGLLREVAGQLLRAAGSIPANVAEGYSRGTKGERRKFLEYALGSSRECIVWYESTAHPARASRIERLVSIRRLLLVMIRTARESVLADRKRLGR